ncbi:MAG TPA: sulfotransferase, partial [Gammaproteobacteria bacterium]
LLENRLRMTEARRAAPEIEAVRVERPLFITGLPRTGTSILHELLGCDPAVRVPFEWEVRHPCPPPTAEDLAVVDEQEALALAGLIHPTTTHTSRKERAERAIRLWTEIIPEYDTMHELGARLPVECIKLFCHEFRSDHLAAEHQVPSYAAWLAGADMRPAYAYHRSMLQLLGWRFRGRRWVLKAPSHLAWLDALSAVYPDACIVQTHRDPLRVMGSVASVLVATARVRSDEVDDQRIAAWFAPESCLALLEGADEVRVREAQETRFYDVRYADLMRDPIATVAGLYRHFGFELTPIARDAMIAYMAAKPKDKHGTHLYGFDETGCDRATERLRFAPYMKRYAVPEEC